VRALFTNGELDYYPKPCRRGPRGVYIIEMEDHTVKVGVSQNFYNRFRQINYAEPIRRIIALFEIEDPKERLALEKRFFDLFYYHRVDGWEDRFTSAEPIERILLSKIYE
jgi:hypothetical protein